MIEVEAKDLYLCFFYRIALGIGTYKYESFKKYVY